MVFSLLFYGVAGALGRGGMQEFFWLDDEAWAAIEPHLPKNQPGARRVDDRRIISGIIHVLKSGCQWKDCPCEYGPSTTVYNRFNRWSSRGHWKRILSTLAAGQWIAETVAVNNRCVKAYRCAHGGKEGAKTRRLGFREADQQQKSTLSTIRCASQSPPR